MPKLKAGKFSKITEKEYFESLSNPNFLELNGLIILESHYTPESFETWQKHLDVHNSPADFQKFENTINHVHLDLFTNSVSLQKEIGEHLCKIWNNTLNTQFPIYDFECKVEHYKTTGWELVLWKKR